MCGIRIRRGKLVVLVLLAVTAGCAAPMRTQQLRGARLWTDSTSSAWQHYQRASDAETRALLARIAEQPLVPWFTEVNAAIRQDVNNLVSRIAAAGALPVFVLYGIPQRDCGSYAAGGARSGEEYRNWIREAAAGIGPRRAVVILEPDALMGLDCLSEAARAERYRLLREAVRTLAANRTVSVYIDAGHPQWHPADVAAARLRSIGVDKAAGFVLNVANTIGTQENIEYGSQISRKVRGKHFIIDTSRNGKGGGRSEWCNPAQAAIGAPPTTQTNHQLVDAYLWIKTPGESDGECNGGPRAGHFWPQAALQLVRNSSR